MNTTSSSSSASPRRKWAVWTVALVVTAFLTGAWMAYFHNEAVRSVLPKWPWVQTSVAKIGRPAGPAEEEDEDPDNTKNEIPVHTAKVARGTVHRYVEAFGVVGPRPARDGEPAGAANLASPVAGVVSKVNCHVGQLVKAKAVLIELDERVAAAAEEQAAAALRQARASLAALKATPRPEQLEIAQLAIDKARSGVDFAQRNYDRLTKLAVDQGTSGKSVEQAQVELGAARSELAVGQRQLAILKASPTPEELRQEEAKVAAAAAAAAAAGVQRQMSKIASPIDATVVAVTVNAGEGVDTTRPLVQLIALDRLTVNVDVAGQDLPEAAEGIEAQLVVETAAGGRAEAAEPLVAKVATVSPAVNATNNAVTLGVDVPAGAKLRPGQAVRVRVVVGTHADCLTVPREAVVTDENGDSVISLIEGAQATHKAVKVGFEEQGQVEIVTDDVKEGATVVTAGAFGLPAASKVKVLD